MAQHKKNPPEIQETQKTCIQFLGQGLSPGVRGGNTLQYSCLRNPMGRGVPWLQSPGRKELDATERLMLAVLLKDVKHTKKVQTGSDINRQERLLRRNNLE